MKNIAIRHGFSGVNRADDAAFFIASRIALAGHYDSHRRAGIPAHIKMMQAGIGCCQHGADKISSQAGQDYLGFGVTKATVEFNDLRAVFG